jgi:D-xylono/L-arabinono-1,4-lactonase
MTGLRPPSFLDQPHMVADTRCEVGEGPLWHPDEACVYWVDALVGRLYRFNPESGRTDLVDTGEPIGGLTLQTDGALLLLGSRGSVRIWRNGRVERTILAQMPGGEGTRFNDAIADPVGHVFSGLLATRDADGRILRSGTLYRIGLDGQPVAVVDGLGTPNGMAFNAAGDGMYATDTLIGTQTIWRWDFDQRTGALSNRAVFLQTALDGSEGRPDGMTVDADGRIWTALWEGGAVLCLAEDGTRLGRIRLPARRVSSLTFGGSDYAEMYVTTGGGQDRATYGSGAGALFRVRVPGVRGVPEHRSRVGLSVSEGS